MAACCNPKCDKNNGAIHNFHLPRIVYHSAISVLEKIDLFGDRRARQKAFPALTEEFGGAETRECLEVVNKMRLIEIVARHRNFCPIGRGFASRQVNGALKTLHTPEQLRCDADLIGEYPDKMPLAQPEMR